jgi:pyruvate dehydrogenase E2 component (dihydrolipoamide acetyltransferase)
MAPRIIPIAMPKWGMEMVEGQIVEWGKNVGDAISPGDVVLDIETEKLNMPYEAEFTGVLRRRFEEEGVFPVGHLLGVVADTSVSDADIDEFVSTYSASSMAEMSPTPAPTAAEPAGYAAPASQPAPAAPTPAPLTNGAMAASAVEAQIESLSVEISPIAARVAVGEGVDLKGVSGTGRLGRVSLDDVEAVAGRPLGRKTRRVNATPRAKKLAAEKGIDISRVAGSGKNGRISAKDVEAAASAAPVQAKAPAPMPVQVGTATVRSEVMSSMRRTIARRMAQAKSEIPHIYLRTEINMAEVLTIRAGVNKRLDGIKTSINDYIVRACGLALMDVPAANVQYGGDQIHYFDQADVGVAVALEGGLIAPIIRGVDRKPVAQIAQDAKDVAARARAGKLTANDIEGGTGTVSNLGMFGITSFDAIVNPPQASILAVGSVDEKPVAVDGQLDLAPIMSVTMSCDHRVIDGAIGAEFLAAFKDLLENPVSLIM